MLLVQQGSYSTTSTGSSWLPPVLRVQACLERGRREGWRRGFFAGYAVYAPGTTTDDALDSLPIRTAFDSAVLPFMEAHAELWPSSVSSKRHNTEINIAARVTTYTAFQNVHCEQRRCSALIALDS